MENAIMKYALAIVCAKAVKREQPHMYKCMGDVAGIRVSYVVMPMARKARGSNETEENK